MLEVYDDLNGNLYIMGTLYNHDLEKCNHSRHSWDRNLNVKMELHPLTRYDSRKITTNLVDVVDDVGYIIYGNVVHIITHVTTYYGKEVRVFKTKLPNVISVGKFKVNNHMHILFETDDKYVLFKIFSNSKHKELVLRKRRPKSAMS